MHVHTMGLLTRHPADRAYRRPTEGRFAPAAALLLTPQAVATATGAAWFLAGVCGALALLFAGLWYWDREHRSAPAAALLAVLMAVRILCAGPLPDAGLLAPETAGTLGTLTFFLLFPALAWLFLTTFPEAFLPWPKSGASDASPGRGLRLGHTLAAAMTLVTGTLFALISMAAPAALTTALTTLMGWLTLPLLAAAASVLVWARRRPGARRFAVAFALPAAAAVHDLLAAGGPALFPAAMTVFLLLSAAAGLHRLATARRNALHLEAAVEHRSKALRAATIAMQASRLAEGQFLAAISHELRTPLTAILGYAQMLESELQPHLTPEHREFFQTIRVSTERLLMLINEVLDLARLESGRAELHPEAVAVRPLVEDLLRQLHPLIAEKNLELETHFEPGAETVHADVMGLRQVLTNLLANAIKFTERGRLTVRATAATLDERPAVALQVIDTGPGIAPDFLPFLFDRFTRERRLYERQQGSGLGLAITRELVLRMHGCIDVESELDRGSTFTVTLPATKPPEAPSDASENPIRHKHDRRPTRRRR